MKRVTDNLDDDASLSFREHFATQGAATSLQTFHRPFPRELIFASHKQLAAALGTTRRWESSAVKEALVICPQFCTSASSDEAFSKVARNWLLPTLGRLSNVISFRPDLGISNQETSVLVHLFVSLESARVLPGSAFRGL